MADLSNYKIIHCLGIGGIGLSAVAEILENNGHVVSGTDMKVSDVTRHLERLGIKVYYEHKPENVENVDLVIYSAAISGDNPEMLRARELKIPCITRAEALGMIMQNYEKSIAVCGTHGKTTVTSMTSLILRNAEYMPTILVGGNLDQIQGNVEIGEKSYFVTEACEYMDSFLSLRPKIGIVLNIDSDHLDYFKDIDHIVSSFRQFVMNIPVDGIVIAYGDNPFVKGILSEVDNKLTYGYAPSCDFYAENIVFDENGFPEFDIYHSGNKVVHIHLGVPGEHNVLNAMASFVTTKYLGVPTEVIQETLAGFGGTHRRFDITWINNEGVKIIDDYAHHPTEIKATLSAAKNVRHNKLWVVFQPHTYTRTKALFDEFADAFGDADELILTDIYAAREKDIYNISSYKLTQEIKTRHPELKVNYVQDFEDIAKYLNKFAVKDDIIITMGAGDIYKLGEMLL